KGCAGGTLPCVIPVIGAGAANAKSYEVDGAYIDDPSKLVLDSNGTGTGKVKASITSFEFSDPAGVHSASSGETKLQRQIKLQVQFSGATTDAVALDYSHGAGGQKDAVAYPVQVFNRGLNKVWEL